MSKNLIEIRELCEAFNASDSENDYARLVFRASETIPYLICVIDELQRANALQEKSIELACEQLRLKAKGFRGASRSQIMRRFLKEAQS